MSEKYKFHDPDELYFITTTVVYFIDLFTRPAFKHIIVDSLRHCQQHKGLVVYAWCLMPSHLHAVVSRQGTATLAEIMRDFKKYTSKQIIATLPQINESRSDWLLRAFARAAAPKQRIQNYKVWQDGTHPIELHNATILRQKLHYIHDNPVVAEIVDEAEDYLYSSARDYAGRPGLLPVEMAC
ncbi:MAG: transposase [Tunicatimonas sp.]